MLFTSHLMAGCTFVRQSLSQQLPVSVHSADISSLQNSYWTVSAKNRPTVTNTLRHCQSVSILQTSHLCRTQSGQGVPRTALDQVFVLPFNY